MNIGKMFTNEIKSGFMSNKHICQSCSMPLDNPDLWGTEKDGSTTNEYCKYCYQNGGFTNPDLTLEEMKEHMMKIMGKDNLPEDILERAMNRLPFLKRWSASNVLLL
jgi:hypothetical protein